MTYVRNKSARDVFEEFPKHQHINRCKKYAKWGYLTEVVWLCHLHLVAHVIRFKFQWGNLVKSLVWSWYEILDHFPWAQRLIFMWKSAPCMGDNLPVTGEIPGFYLRWSTVLIQFDDYLDCHCTLTIVSKLSVTSLGYENLRQSG